MFKALIAAVFGAVIAFVVYSASWLALPWHYWDHKSFKQGGEVISQALKTEALEAGIYVIPNVTAPTVTKIFNNNANLYNERHPQWEEKAVAGPFIFLSVNPKGLQWDMKKAQALQLICTFITALFLIILLNAMGINGAWKSAFFCAFAMGIGAFIANAGYFIWWGFPLFTTLINVADAWVAWFISGIFMGAIIKKEVKE